MITFSIVVPIIPKHSKFLPRLLTNMEKWSDISELIIAASDCDDSFKAELSNLQNNNSLPFPIVVLPTGQKVYAAGNRNRAWDVAQGDFICFCDADDLFHPSRISVMKEVISSTEADVIVHDFWRMKPSFFLRFSRIKNIAISHTENIFRATFENAPRDRQSELGVQGDTNITLPRHYPIGKKIQHGHPVVRRSIQLRYGHLAYGEDGMFIKDALESGLKVIHLQSRLSIYDVFSWKGSYQLIKSVVKHSIKTFLIKCGYRM